ncbi:MAG: hypothetical protein ACTSSP_09830 [Candidatus Asgardarchaeia archaeon]
MIRVLIELDLIFPYKISMTTLAEFCSLWNCTILYGGTKRLRAIISMPVNYFKVIFGNNPREGKYNVPNGMEHFIESLRVKKVMVK